MWFDEDQVYRPPSTMDIQDTDTEDSMWEQGDNTVGVVENKMYS